MEGKEGKEVYMMERGKDRMKEVRERKEETRREGGKGGNREQGEICKKGQVNKCVERDKGQMERVRERETREKREKYKDG